jgi:hypothetical protein
MESRNVLDAKESGIQKPLNIFLRGRMEDFSSYFNKYYKENPPEYVIDDTGIRHQKEIPLPAKYEQIPCECGTIHHLFDETWYHSHMNFYKDANIPNSIKVVKRCKKCDQILMLTLANK